MTPRRHQGNNNTTAGYVHLYTGDGKGKTTAAVGLAVRAAGARKRVCIIQFLKGRPSAELTALRKLAPLVTVRRFGTPRLVTGKPSQDDARHARRALACAAASISGGRYDLVILDEVCLALHFRLAAVGEVLALLDGKPRHVEVALTGRKAPRELVERADLVTEMREVKHYYARGVQARRGIEW